MFEWYRLFNLTDFAATGLVSITVTIELVGIGLKEILITKGVSTSIQYDGVFLSINLNSKNPFRYADKAVFLDPNNDVWLGVYNAG